MGKKNYGKSVKTRLLNLMNETGYKYMYLLARYFNERLLYRVSVSQYKDKFLLKGGSLLYAMNGLEARPTVDVGLWRTGSVVAGISWLVYSKKSWVSYAMKIEPITVEKKYFGTRFYFTAHLADRTRRL